jgi:hypothetical protein
MADAVYRRRELLANKREPPELQEKCRQLTSRHASFKASTLTAGNCPWRSFHFPFATDLRSVRDVQRGYIWRGKLFRTLLVAEGSGNRCSSDVGGFRISVGGERLSVRPEDATCSAQGSFRVRSRIAASSSLSGQEGKAQEESFSRSRDPISRVSS